MLHLGVVLYLASYLLAATPLSTYVWSRGAHITPEQRAYHEMLVRMGYPDHHHTALPPDASPNKHSHPKPFFFPPATAVAGLSLATPFAPQSVPLLLVGAAMFLILSRLIRELCPADTLPPRAITVEPPERPPILLG